MAQPDKGPDIVIKPMTFPVGQTVSPWFSVKKWDALTFYLDGLPPQTVANMKGLILDLYFEISFDGGTTVARNLGHIRVTGGQLNAGKSPGYVGFGTVSMAALDDKAVGRGRLVTNQSFTSGVFGTGTKK